MASSQAWSYALSAGVMGFILPGVDNAAHVGGFAGGYLAGRLLDPLSPSDRSRCRRIICLGVSVLTILVPIVRAVVDDPAMSGRLRRSASAAWMSRSWARWRCSPCSRDSSSHPGEAVVR